MIESYNGKSADWQKVNEPRVFHSEIGYDRQGKIKGGAAASCDYADNDRKDYPFNGCYKTFRIMLTLCTINCLVVSFIMLHLFLNFFINLILTLTNLIYKLHFMML